jgi:hypothetical protein
MHFRGFLKRGCWGIARGQFWEWRSGFLEVFFGFFDGDFLEFCGVDLCCF